MLFIYLGILLHTCLYSIWYFEGWKDRELKLVSLYMSKEVLVLLRSQLSESHPQSSLPFLYQTRTILTLSRNRSRLGHLPKCRHFTAASSLRVDHIPFEKPGDDSESFSSNNRYDVSHRSKSTITPSERAIFDRIFNEVRDLRASSKDEVRPEEKLKRDNLDNRLQAILKPHAPTPSIPLTTKQKASAAKDKSRDKLADELFVQKKPPPVEKKKRKREKVPVVAGIRTGPIDEQTADAILNNQPIPEKDQKDSATPSKKLSKAEQLIHEARERNMKKVMTALRKAPDDAAVWDVLEQHVFSKAAQMTQNFDKEIARAKENFTKGLESKINSRLKLQARLESEGLDPTTKKLKPLPVSPLAILQTNYAPQLLYAMRLLRAYAPSSPYAPAILSRMRALGPASYFLGATTELYNEAMFLRWRIHLDVHGVGKLVHEMLDKGLEANADTLRVLNAGARWRQDAQLGVHGYSAQTLAELEDWQRGWARWVEGFRRAKKNVEERVERRKEVEEEKKVKRQYRQLVVKTVLGRQRFKEDVRKGEEEVREKGFRRVAADEPEEAEEDEGRQPWWARLYIPNHDGQDAMIGAEAMKRRSRRAQDMLERERERMMGPMPAPLGEAEGENFLAAPEWRDQEDLDRRMVEAMKGFKDLVEEDEKKALPVQKGRKERK